MYTDSNFDRLPDTGGSRLMVDESYPELSELIEGLTGITQKELLEKGESPNKVFKDFNDEFVNESPSVVIAYNGAFDLSMLKAEIGRYPVPDAVLGLPWYCAMQDVEDNYRYKCWKLSHLALDKGVPVDPSKLHRAIDDIELTRQMLKATGVTAQDMIAYAAEPWVTVQAVTTPPWKDKGVSNEKAKGRGYSWQVAKGDPERRKFENVWVKRIKMKDFEKEVDEATFPVKMLK